MFGLIWRTKALALFNVILTVSACDGPLVFFPNNLDQFFNYQYQAQSGEVFPRSPNGLWEIPLSEVAHLQFLQTVRTDFSSEHPLACWDMRAVGAIDDPGGFRVNANGTVSNFHNTYTPVILNADTRGNIFFQTVRASSISVAVVGMDFDITEVIDEDTRQFTLSAMGVARELWPGSGFDRWFATTLDDKEIFVAGTEICDGFRIFHIEIQ